MKKEKDKRKKSRRLTVLSWTAALLTLAVTTSALILPALTMTTEDNVVIESSEGSATVEGENEAAAADTAADVQTGTAEAAKDTGEETAQENVTAEEKSATEPAEATTEEKSSESKSETSASGESQTESGTSASSESRTESGTSASSESRSESAASSSGGSQAESGTSTISKSESTAAAAESTASSPQSTAESGAESTPEGIDVTGTMEPAGKVTIPVMNTDETGEIDDTEPTTFLTVEYGDDTLPVGASIKARMMNPEETLYSSYESEALKAVDEVNKEVALLFDVTITDLEGNAVEPANPVNVKVMLSDEPDEEKTYCAVHFTRELEENDPDEEDGGSKTKANLLQKIENKLHLTEEKTEPLCQVLPVEQEDNELTFTAESFSPYAIVEVTEAMPVKKAVAKSTSKKQGSILDKLDYSTSAANAWQVVDQEYSGNEPKNKTNYGNDFYQAVRVQKNVIPTGTENEFYVYLSVDTKLLVSEFLQHATYGGTTSNNYHKKRPGDVVQKMTGNEDVDVSGVAKSGYNSAKFTIEDSNEKVIAENVTLYWSQAENVTLYLKTSQGYILVGVKVNEKDNNTVLLSSDAERYIYADAMKLISLDSVTDIMGEHIEYLGTVDGDYNTGPTSYKTDTRTLTWTPVMKTNPISDTENGEDGQKTTWSHNVAELLYKVRLRVQDEGFTSCASNMQSKVGDPESYAVNGSATLSYQTKVGNQTDSGTAEFQKPYVRGLLYDYQIKKVDKDKQTPLPGAVFSFTSTGNNSGVTYNLTGTSGEDGMVSWKHGANSAYEEGTSASAPGVAWGNYTVTETTAPDGYKMSDDGKNKMSVTLCYTIAPGNLAANGTHMIYKEIYKEKENTFVTVTNTKIPETPVRIIKAEVARPETTLSGAEFNITKSGAKTGSEWKDKKTQKSAKDGILFNGNLPYGTYTLTEDTAPDGYNKLSENVTITVSENSVEYTQTDNNGGGTTPASLLDNTQPASTKNPYVVYIYNNPGVELPSTGGFGKLPYTLGGMMLLAASALMYGFRKRRGERRIK